MRLDSQEFSEKNKSNTKEPVFVVELSFDDLNTDLHYLTSKPVDELLGNLAAESFWANTSRSDTAIIGVFSPEDGVPLVDLGLAPGDTVTAAMFVTSSNDPDPDLIVRSYDDSQVVLSQNSSSMVSVNEWVIVTHTIDANATRLMVRTNVNSGTFSVERISVVKGTAAYQGNDYIPNTVINDTLKIVSSTSQKINPDKANSTIGSIKFECLDTGLTELQRTKLTEDKGLNGKRVRVYQGYVGLLWSQYQLIQTQVIDSSITYLDGVYAFQCADIQRAMRKKVFEPKETVLTSAITDIQTTIPALDTTDFDLVYQVPSAQGKTLLRSMQQSGNYPTLNGVDDIGIIRIENDEDYELAIWTGKDASNFTGVVRGVLGTKALAVEVQSGSTDQDAPKITEYVYLSLPAVKAAYAILTGSLYGHAGKFLPDHWHLGISTDFIQTSAFTNIGSDLWDLTDDDNGYPLVLQGPKSEDGKKFIEQEIYYMIGVYSPILSTGELSLKRLRFIGESGSYDRYINEDSVVKYGALKEDLKSILNAFVLKWHYDERREKFARTSVFVDPNSMTRHGESDPKVIELKTLHGSRHSDHLIRANFDSIRTRYAGPPLLLPLTLTPDQNDLEVGDIVRVNLQAIEDATNNTVGPLNRNFEVQRVTNNWITGDVKVSLFASSERSSDIIPDNTEPVPNAFVNYQGTEINATNFPGLVISAGGVTTITGTISLVGSTDLNSAGSTFYCTEDLTLDASGEIQIDDNVQIRVDGFFQVNALIEGSGRGYAGGVADSISGHLLAPIASNLGIKGVGKTIAQGGYRSTNPNILTHDPANDLQTLRVTADGSHSQRIITGDVDSPDRPILTVDSSGLLSGMPSTLMGSSGSSGGGIGNSLSVAVQGGDGGASGSGLAIFSKGMAFGASGQIDLSGVSGQQGGLLSRSFSDGLGTTNLKAYAGAGAGGAPGSLFVVVLDSSQTFPVFNGTNLVLNHGLSPEQGQAGTLASIGYTDSGNGRYTGAGTFSHSISSPIGGGGSLKQVENAWQTHHQVVFLDTRSTAVDDEPAFVENEATFTLTEVTNTPATPDGNISTVEVSVTPSSDSNYSYSVVDYREQGSTAWIAAPPASNESLIELVSDGKTYEIRIRAVSTKGNISPSGPIDTITLTDINGRTDAELALIYPFAAITNLGLDEVGTAFTGPGPLFQWDHDNGERAYFNYYEIEIRTGATLLRTEKTASPFYSYSYDKNVTDYRKLNSDDGTFFDLEIRVRAVSKYFNDLGNLYSSGQILFNASASFTEAPDNLRFIPFRSQIDNTDATPYTLINKANMRVLGSKISKINGTDGSWDASVHSFESFSAGAFVSFRIASTGYRMIGLNDNPDFDNHYTTINYALYTNTDLNLHVYENGIDQGVLSTYAVGDVCSIVYDGAEVKFYKNGVQLGEIRPDLPELKLYLDTSFATINSVIDSIQFGPFANYADQSISNITKTNDLLSIARPIGGEAAGYSISTDGAIVITLPQLWTDTMLRFTVNVYNYLSNTSFSLNVGGYTHGSGTQWLRTFASLIGSDTANNRVRFGHNGTNAVVVIGTATDVGAWQHPQIKIRDFEASFLNFDVDQWNDGWSVDILTDLTGYAFTVDYADALIDASKIVGQGTLATEDSLPVPDTRGTNEDPNYYRALGVGLYPEFKQNTTIGAAAVGALGTYSYMTTFVLWGDTSGGVIKQEIVDNAGVKYRRIGNGGDTAWGAWVKSFDGGALPGWATDISGRPDDQQLLNSLLFLDDWADGDTGSTSYFNFVNGASNVSRVEGIGPFGESEVLWRAAGTGDGWVTDQVTINPAQSYRLSAWARMNSMGDQGWTRLKVNGANAVRTLAGVLQATEGQFFNPFVSGNSSLEDKWVLLIGYVWGHATSRTVDSGLSGIYDPDTGAQIYAGVDFKFDSAATSIAHKVENIYSIPGPPHTDYSKPRLGVIDGSEKTIIEMLTASHAPGNLLNDQQAWTDINNVPDRFTDAPTTGINVTASYMGYYDGSVWQAYLDDQGNLRLSSNSFAAAGIQFEHNAGNPRSYIGDGADKFIKYENGELEFGRLTKLRSIDTYNSNGSVYTNFVFNSDTSLFGDEDNYFVPGALTSEPYIQSSFGSPARAYVLKHASFGLEESLLDSLTFDSIIEVKTKVSVTNMGVGSEANFGVGTIAFPSVGAGNDDNIAFKFDGSDGKIKCSAQNGSSSVIGGTIADSGINYVEGQFYKLEIFYIPSTSVRFYIDDALVATITTDVPGAFQNHCRYDFGFYCLSGNSGETTRATFKQVKQVYYPV